MILGIIAVSLATLGGLVIFINIGLLLFVQTNNFGSAFNIVEVFSIFKNHFQDLLAITSFVLILQALLLCAGLGILSPFALFWGWLVQANLFAQCVKEEIHAAVSSAAV
jgi:hypothetical protein